MDETINLQAGGREGVVEMRKGVVLCAVVLAGCATGDELLLEAEQDVALTVPTAACESSMDDKCMFINSPVKLSSRPLRLPGSPYPFFKTRETLEFVDARQKVWVAPAGILTDGASIPPIFVPFIGDPRSKEFLNAATVHDSYCAESNRNTPYFHTAPWQDVHRMFYDGLRASGTPAIKAKIMYAAVYLGGPRWSEVRPAPKRRAANKKDVDIVPAAVRSARDLQSNVPLTEKYTPQQLIAAFKKAQAYIKSNNPTIAEVEIYLTKLEIDLSKEAISPNKKRINVKTLPVDPRTRRGISGGDGGIGGEDIDDGGAGSAGTDSGGGGGDQGEE